MAAQQHGLVVLGEDGEVLRPAKLWNDTESAPDTGMLLAALPGGQAAWVSADLADRGELERAAEEADGAFGPPDILVNCAGVNLRPPLPSLTVPMMVPVVSWARARVAEPTAQRRATTQKTSGRWRMAFSPREPAYQK